jgi:hypothetical protein
MVFIGGMIAYLLYGIGWLRPDTWFLQTAPLWTQRLTLLILVSLFGLTASLMDPRPSLAD